METNSASDAKNEILDLMKICQANSLISKYNTNGDSSEPIKKRKLLTEKQNTSLEIKPTKKKSPISPNWQTGKVEVKPKSPQKLKKFSTKLKNSFKGYENNLI